MIFIVIGILLICIYGIVRLYLENRKYKKLNDSISFRESMDLTNLPIITCTQGSLKYNFLIDTGSTRSIINSSLQNDIIHEPLNIKTTITGAGEGELNATISKVYFNFKDKQYSDDFQFADMSNAFDSIKNSSGVTIHGILGNTFLDKYRYIIDFSKYVAYPNR